MVINLDKVRKQLTYELVYEKDGEELFTIKPKLGEKKRFLEVMKKLSEDQNGGYFVDWLVGLVKEAGETDEETLNLIKTLIEEYEGDFITQTSIGFKTTTKEEVEKRNKAIEEKLLEKNL
jgi:hypothetical protein